MNGVGRNNRGTVKAWGCPRTKNRSQWCHAWCTPVNGIGDCGRVAAHGIMGRTQQAILHFKQKKQADSTR